MTRHNLPHDLAQPAPSVGQVVPLDNIFLLAPHFECSASAWQILLSIVHNKWHYILRYLSCFETINIKQKRLRSKKWHNLPRSPLCYKFKSIFVFNFCTRGAWSNIKSKHYQIRYINFYQIQINQFKKDRDKPKFTKISNCPSRYCTYYLLCPTKRSNSTKLKCSNCKQPAEFLK